MQVGSGGELGPPRKRLRRDTRSCYECRRRKVKCQLTSEHVSSCCECLKSGVQCSIQGDAARFAKSGSGTEAASQGREDRLERIEQMLRELIERQGVPHYRTLAPIQPPRLHGGQNPSDLSFLWDDFTSVGPEAGEISPGNLLYSSSPTSGPPQPRLSASLNPTPMLNSESDTVKHFLISLLPTQEDVTTIVNNTTAWVLELARPPGAILKPSGEVKHLDISAVVQCDAVIIAKTLLYLAIYIQQLPPDFDIQRLQMHDVEAKVQCYRHNVSSLVLAHEEMACSVQGLQCLLLLGMVFINDGLFRKAWVNFRRAVDVARIKDCHNGYSSIEQHSTSEEIALHRHLWLSAVMGDCYTSLLLGIEPRSGGEPFFSDYLWNDRCADADANFERRLCHISAKVSHRNLSGAQKANNELTCDIDNALNALEDSMPDSWWRTPATNGERSIGNAQEYDRLVCHLWFFQLRMFTHLPSLFVENGDRDSKRSRSICLEASRITLHRYLGLRHPGNSQVHTRVIEVAAFIASVILVLASALGPVGRTSKRFRRSTSDIALMEQVIAFLTSLGNSSGREHIAKQSAEVITALLAVCDSPESWSSSSGLGGSPFIHDSVFDQEKLPHCKAKSGESTFLATEGSLEDGEKAGLQDVLSSSFQRIIGRDSIPSRLIDTAFLVAQVKSQSQALQRTGEAQDLELNALDTFEGTDLINWDP
ncbi:Fc.00g083400.m01.CDS01 [Cosmosporella sp. VM-42]